MGVTLVNKFFGIVALVGLAYFWLTERDAQAVPNGTRTLTASFYGDECRGKLMANGKPFDPEKFTCASWEFYGKELRVTGPLGSVVVFCSDKGPAKRLLKSRQLDLSRAAFSRVAYLSQGLAEVTVSVL